MNLKEGQILYCKDDFRCVVNPEFVCKKGDSVYIDNIEYNEKDKPNKPSAYCVVNNDGEWTCVIIFREESTVIGYTDHGKYFGRYKDRIRRIAKSFL